MTLPYENATSGERALGEIQKLLRGFGCTKFGSMCDDELQEILIQFEYRGRPVSVKASVRGYAAAWLREHPFNASRHKATRVEYERKAMNIASIAVYSILRDWIKGQRCTAADATFALASFGLEDAKEDNHVPSGRVRNFWRPVADNMSGYECPCVDDEPTIREDKGDFVWRGVTV